MKKSISSLQEIIIEKNAPTIIRLWAFISKTELRTF